jgi:hypothetical protein
MDVFNIKNPLEWDLILNGELIAFENYNGSRSIAFSVNSTGPVDVFVAFNEDMKDRKLLGSSSGLFSCGYSAQSVSYVQIVHKHPETLTYVHGPAASHIVPTTEEPSFVELNPQGRRNSDIDRIMYEMRLNEKRRDMALQSSIDALKAKAPKASPQPETIEVIDDVQPAKTPAKVSAAD